MYRVITVEIQRPYGQCTGLRVEKFCVLGQTTSLSQCLFPPKSKEWVSTNCQGSLMKTLWWLASHPGKRSNTSSHFMQGTGKSFGWVGQLASMSTDSTFYLRGHDYKYCGFLCHKNYSLFILPGSCFVTFLLCTWKFLLMNSFVVPSAKCSSTTTRKMFLSSPLTRESSYTLMPLLE